MMKLQIFNYMCAGCGLEFRAPELPFNSYGEFLLRSANGGVVYLNALDDPTYKEVDGLIAASAKMRGEKKQTIASTLQRLYGWVACDPDEMGKFFEIERFPTCPFCASQEIKAWEEAEPPEFVEANIPPVTHHGWNMLTDSGKKARVERALLEERN